MVEQKQQQLRDGKFLRSLVSGVCHPTVEAVGFFLFGVGLMSIHVDLMRYAHISHILHVFTHTQIKSLLHIYAYKISMI